MQCRTFWVLAGEEGVGEAETSPHACPGLGRIFSPILGLSEEEKGQIWVSHAQLAGVGGEGDRGQEAVTG